MSSPSPDRVLLEKLLDIPEVAASGFSVREGLTGAGVTVLKGRTYYGSWRVTAGTLCWIHASPGCENVFVTNVDDAVRQTLLTILHSLEGDRELRAAS